MVTKASLLRQLLDGPDPLVVAGAHNALSARLVEEAGFDAVWASGFEISASFGIPDANLLTMSENVAVAGAIDEAISIPVIADCDNGYGNAINVIRTVLDYEKAGVAGICIEDNIFPKRCSFYAGTRRELVSAEEHAGKVRAAIDSRRSEDFVVIARTEALIAGWGLQEALDRASAYADAGADLCLIHSKSASPDEVLEFARHWDRPTPLVCVPTTYNQASVDDLAAGGYKVVIFANHGLRTAIQAMRQTLGALRKSGRAADIEDRIAPLADVFALVDTAGLRRDEGRYLPAGGTETMAVVLAAGADGDLSPLTEDRPRTMLEVRGKSILEHQIEAFNHCSIRDIVVVRGYHKEAVRVPGPTYRQNEEFAETGEVHSLLRAEGDLVGRTVVVYGDILFESRVVESLLRSPADLAIAVDRSGRFRQAPVDGPAPDLVIEGPDGVVSIGRRIDREAATAEFLGLWMMSQAGVRRVVEACRELAAAAGTAVHEAPDFRRANLTDLLQVLVDAGHPVATVAIEGGVREIDTFEDYRRAWAGRSL